MATAKKEESKLVSQLEEVQKETKFSQEEMDSLSSLQQRYLECQTTFGQISVQKLQLQQQIDGLSKSEQDNVEAYQQVQQDEQEMAKKLNEKYGDGTLDPQTGVFTPNS